MGGILNEMYRSVDGIDFEAQRQQDRWTTILLVLSALVWLGIGWLVQDFGLTVYGMLGVMGVVLLVIITDARYSYQGGDIGNVIQSYGTKTCSNRRKIIDNLMWQYIVLTYVLVSAFFFCFPTLLRRRKTLMDPVIQRAKAISPCTPIVCAHRGGSHESTENTIGAFRRAKGIGVQILEFDVFLTKDNKAVVFHDKDLERLCGKEYAGFKIQDFNYEDLPRIQKEIRLPFAVNRFRVNKDDEVERKIPLLEEVIRESGNTPINFELKVRSDELMQQALELVRLYKKEKQTIWGSLSRAQSQKCKELAPQIPRFFPPQQMLSTFIYYIFGLLPFVNIEHDSLQFMVVTSGFVYEWYGIASPRTLGQKAYVGLCRFFNLISGPLYWHLRKRGVHVMQWSPNEEDEFNQAMGGDGIITDSPLKLINYLEKKRK